MKIERINSKRFKIYVYSSMIHEETFLEDIKSLLKKIQKRYSLKGFYKVIVCEKNCGIFLDLIQLEDSFYRSTLDFKIEFHPEMNIYFQTKDYFLICLCDNIWYFDEYYYALVDDSFDKILEKVEFGDFIFGSERLDFLDKAYIIS